MKKVILLLIIIVISSGSSFSQFDIVYDDEVYDESIGAVEFRYRGQFTGFPIMNLRGNQSLLLSFDDFNDENRYLNCKVILCNADWTPSELDPIEYIDGFDDNRIEEFELSFNTRAEYINYEVQIPNEDFRITKSGNYIMYVYDSDRDVPVLTRRFLVLEDKLKIAEPVVEASSQVAQRNTHHEIKFKINSENFPVANPDKELAVVVLQNWRWDNAIKNIKPRFTRSNIIDYYYPNKIVFETGNEFRGIDIRSFDFLTPQMKHIDIFDDGYGVYLKSDLPRYTKPYLSYRDLNGDFVIQNNDNNGNSARQILLSPEGQATNIESVFSAEGNMRRNKLNSDYADVHFELTVSQPYFDKDVYVVGQFNNWKLRESNRMLYNESTQSYKSTLELKQGYYDYVYAQVDKGKNEISLMETEGSHYETRNEYIILVYQRAIGDRHDRLVGYRTISSSPF